MPKDCYATYEVLPVEGGGGWYVIVTPRNGPVEKRYGFATEAEARHWVRNDMVARTLRS
jgi:hypothetical protein